MAENKMTEDEYVSVMRAALLELFVLLELVLAHPELPSDLRIALEQHPAIQGWLSAGAERGTQQ